MEELLSTISRLLAFHQQEVMDFPRFLVQRSGLSAEAGHAAWSDETCHEIPDSRLRDLRKRLATGLLNDSA